MAVKTDSRRAVTQHDLEKKMEPQLSQPLCSHRMSDLRKPTRCLRSISAPPLPLERRCVAGVTPFFRSNLRGLFLLQCQGSPSLSRS